MMKTGMGYLPTGLRPLNRRILIETMSGFDYCGSGRFVNAFLAKR
jgi:hypothetical protein